MQVKVFFPILVDQKLVRGILTSALEERNPF